VRRSVDLLLASRRRRTRSSSSVGAVSLRAEEGLPSFSWSPLGGPLLPPVLGAAPQDEAAAADAVAVAAGRPPRPPLTLYGRLEYITNL